MTITFQPLPDGSDDPWSSNRPARGAATPLQGQSALTAERQRFLVQPGVKGHRSYIVWDTLHAVPYLETESRQIATATAAALNTQPIDPP